MSDKNMNDCYYCGALAGHHHLPNCERPRDDEMASGLIHEPGTGDIEYECEPVEEAANGTESESVYLRRLLNEEREANTTLAKDAAMLSMRVFNAERDLSTATQQRDFLSRQVDSLVQRLAGSHVAAGSFDMASAQGFVQKEILPINQALAQIAAPQQEQGDV